MICLLILNKVLGQENPTDITKRVDDYLKWSRECFERAQLDQATLYNNLADSLAINYFGTQSIPFAKVCLNYGKIYGQRNFELAQEYLGRAEGICVKLRQQESLLYFQILSQLGSLSLKYFDKRECRGLFNEVFQKIALGNLANPALNRSIYNKLGSMALSVGAIQEANRCFNYADSLYILDGRERFIEYPDFLTKVGNLFYEGGRYRDAEYFLLKARKNYEANGDTNAEGYASCLEILGHIYFKVGNYKGSSLQYGEVLELFRSSGSVENSKLAGCLTNLGNISLRKKRFDEAEQYYLEAQELFKRDSCRDLSEYVISLNNLGVLYRERQNYPQAFQCFNEVIEIGRSKMHYDYASFSAALFNLGHLYFQKGKFELAEEYFIEALKLRSYLPDRCNNGYTNVLRQLAQLYEVTRRYDKVEEILEEYLSIISRQLNDVSNFLTESELSHFTSARDKDAFLLSSIIQNRYYLGENTEKLTAKLYELISNQKGFLVDQVQRKFSVVNNSPELFSLVQELRTARWKLSYEYTKNQSLVDDLLIEELEEKTVKLEKDLIGNSALASMETKWVSWKSIKAKLRKNEAAVEFINFRKTFPHGADSVFYAAIALLNSDEQPRDSMPIFIPLFCQNELDRLIHNAKDGEMQRKLYIIEDKYVDSATVTTNDAYELIWRKIVSRIGSVRVIYYSPCGDLHRINLGVIAMATNLANEEDTMKCVEELKVIRLLSTREITKSIAEGRAINDAVIYGGINYTRDTSCSNRNGERIAEERGLKLEGMDNVSFSVEPWKYLYQSEMEAKMVANILLEDSLEVKLMTGNEGSEESFKKIGLNGMKSPDVIHIATHGFFFPDKFDSGLVEGAELDDLPLLARLSKLPMLRSGLIMAGGNDRWLGEYLQHGTEDGILTSFEIAELNLSSTLLVILSACETGLGDIQGYEGVYGLQRAFRIAGVSQLIMSLWQVDDEASRIFMQEFYKGMINRRLTIFDALRNAQKALRSSKRFNDPYYWAGWVLIQ